MNKQNFFYPKKNNWDIGWPCSPRLSSLLVLGMVVGLLFTFISCGTNSDEVVISKEEYSKLKGEVVSKRTITFPKESTAENMDWKIIQGSNGHDYMENGNGNGYILMHYIECNKCKKK